MDNSIYIALSRQAAVFRDLDVTSNNVANSSTPGFTAEKVMFSQYLENDGNHNKMAFTSDISTRRDLSEGRMETTGNPFDMAISGPGYFTVETPLGNRYTRAGNFQLDGNGTLVTADGNPVLDNAGQRITFDPDAPGEIKVRQDGAIQVGNDEIATIGVVNVENQQVMERLASNYYKSDVTPTAVEGSKILSGMVEQSNVQGVSEITHLVDLNRSVASITRFIDVQYELQRRAGQTLAKSNA